MKLINPDLPWYVARTGIRQEDRAEENLRAKGYDAYVPRMRLEIVNRRTKLVNERTVVLNGFQCYCFVAVPTGDFYTARECVGVEHFLGVLGCPQRIPGASVAELQAMEIDGRFDVKLGVRLGKGDRVRIKNEKHSLAGHVGTIQRTDGKKRLWAMMLLLGGMVPVEFKIDDVEKAA